ncbi:MAG: type II toxin-antitoxin system VapC family toxin [Acidimicrobiaceae bacterium]|nr:type II toxin-antitoxin system VapC family toxin [Acidimicrobiaceae bacterium]
MVSLLLDTHVLLWANEAPERLSPDAVTALEDPGNELLVSPVSVAEIEIKRQLGKLSMRHSCAELVEHLGARWLDLTAAHAAGIRVLPTLHRDPFDRLLVAQAIAENLALVTSDRKVIAYPVVTLRA